MKKDALIYFDLITSLKTTREVDDFSLEIDTLTSSLFNISKMSFDKALNSINQTLAKKITEILLKNNLDTANKEKVRDFLATLKDLIKKFKVIKLTLAFDPSRKTVENIHEFVSQNLGTGYILDIEVDESILAGAAIMFNGKYKDFTLKKSLEEAFANKRDEIVRTMNT